MGQNLIFVTNIYVYVSKSLGFEKVKRTVYCILTTSLFSLLFFIGKTNLKNCSVDLDKKHRLFEQRLY